MPQKISMYFPQVNSYQAPPPPRVQVNNANVASVNKNTFTPPLYTSMINRIHKAKPGCGSCGKH